MVHMQSLGITNVQKFLATHENIYRSQTTQASFPTIKSVARGWEWGWGTGEFPSATMWLHLDLQILQNHMLKGCFTVYKLYLQKNFRT